MLKVRRARKGTLEPKAIQVLSLVLELKVIPEARAQPVLRGTKQVKVRLEPRGILEPTAIKEPLEIALIQKQTHVGQQLVLPRTLQCSEPKM